MSGYVEEPLPCSSVRMDIEDYIGSLHYEKEMEESLKETTVGYRCNAIYYIIA
jgi:hypothetical protein